MSNVQFIMGLLLYIFCISTLISYFAVGMGYTEISGVNDLVTYNAPDDTLSNIPIIGESLSDLAATTAFIGAYLTTISAVLFWTLPEPLFPLWANIIFIKIPLIGLIVSVIEVLLP